MFAVLLTSGCGAKSAAGGNATGNEGSSTDKAQTEQQTGQQNGQAPNRPAMNPEQRQLTIVFQSLIAMDKADGLSITKDEASQLLPIVQASISAGKLSSDDQSKIEGKLTPEQKKFVDDFLANIQQRMQNWNGNGKDNGSGNSSGANRGNGDKPNGGDRQRPNNTDHLNSGQGGQGNGNQPRRSGDGQDRGRNLGEQLVQLLQSKA